MSTDMEGPEYIDPMKVKPQATGLRYGLVGSLLAIVLSLVSNMMGWSTKPGMGIVVTLLSLVIFIAIIAMAIKHHRDNELGGFITLGRAVTVGLIAVLVIAIIGAIFNYIYTTIIDPSFFENLMAGLEEQWERQGLTDAQIESARNMVSRFRNPVLSAAVQIFTNLLLGLIVSLIVGAIMKRKLPAG